MTVPVTGAVAAVPADVRAKGDDAVSTYQAAQGFERLLVDRLTAAMTTGSSLAEGPYASTIGQGMADGIMSGGGLGLTDALYRSMTLGDGAAS